MAMIRTFRIYPENKQFIEKVLRQQGFSYELKEDNAFYKAAVTNLSKQQMEKIIERSVCLRQQAESRSKKPVFSLREINTGNITKTHGFHVLKKDRDNYEKFYG